MNDTPFASFTPDIWAKFKRDYEKDCELVGRMRRAGVEILACSDGTKVFITLLNVLLPPLKGRQ